MGLTIQAEVQSKVALPASKSLLEKVMKTPFKGPIIRFNQQDPKDLKLRRSARILQRVLMIKMNSPEIKEELRKAIMAEGYCPNLWKEQQPKPKDPVYKNSDSDI